ncbi:MAG: hypothetical protein L0216_01615 [Planctomycetales bacterium]|nr:hypothetical protein [Planctomycetales bacterium]
MAGPLLWLGYFIAFVGHDTRFPVLGGLLLAGGLFLGGSGLALLFAGPRGGSLRARALESGALGAAFASAISWTMLYEEGLRPARRLVRLVRKDAPSLDIQEQLVEAIGGYAVILLPLALLALHSWVRFRYGDLLRQAEAAA